MIAPVVKPNRLVSLLAIVALVFVLALYYVIRYEGQWAETDTAVLTRLTRLLIEEETLIPEAEAYAQGYGYPVLASFVTQFTGISITQFQQLLVPFLAVWVIFPAWLFYREVTSSSLLASIGTTLLFLQPEFLFVVLRSSHEKFTRGLMFLALYLLIRSIYSRSTTSKFAALVISFYLTIYAVITNNSFLAISFIVTIMVAMLGVGLVTLIQKQSPQSERAVLSRLQYVLLTSGLFAFAFAFYIYQPAITNFGLLQSIADKLATLLLGFETSNNNPYGVVNLGWINLPTYFLLSLSNWLLLIVAMVLWVWQTAQVLLLRRPFETGRLMLLWAFFGAFGFVGGLSIIADLSGAIAGNLQQRAFPSFIMIAVGLFVYSLRHLLKKGERGFQMTRWGFALSIVLFGVLGLLKVTQEPNLGNNWVFYQQNELMALHWIDSQTVNNTIWTDFNERLNTAYDIQYGQSPNNNRLDAFTVEPETRYFLSSETLGLRSQRLGQPLPYPSDNSLIYDNGAAKIRFSRPETPYQK